MGEVSKISWTDATFNGWWGCREVSPACDHCYARELARRFGFVEGGKSGPELWGEDSERRLFGEKHWNEPLKWNREALAKFGRPMRVFCQSMADIFEVNPKLFAERERLLRLIHMTHNLEWLLLTKRYEQIKTFPEFWKLPNVRMGVTVENQTYDFRIVSGVTWLSVEPMLGPLDLRHFLLCNCGVDPKNDQFAPPWAHHESCPYRARPLTWIIIGGESGYHAREMELEWALDLIQQCRDAGVAVHFKQTGDVLARKLGLKDKSGKNPNEWPKELQIQEFPKSK